LKDYLELLLPQRADNEYRGHRAAVIVFLLIAVIGTVRSLIHFLAPDGGAGSIAGIDLSVDGADGIIFAFALWGSAQLLYGFIQLIVYFRYKNLIPLMYMLIIMETLMRILIGRVKPVQFAGTPPGAIGNYIILPLSIVMLFLALYKSKSK